ncbi:hypothetical protein [Pseudarthrobacter sp. NIBRBAC000502770]|uniref:hypothetical protein n=1 Tax=Pseudarthrobacter sp. NIBRBAC000502770 TaxID=2590785 RepID=UPI0011404C56|nr:hypothetical protein [Pseudarthrobacter sp. NIBRBAC000502770]QDG87195.1 hypothetical protein NIBR502770_00780 [Pseudarthrobacter sp. NIBRBAC000502770]
MDILAGVNREWLAALPWLAAVLAAAVVLAWRRRRPDLAAPAAVAVFMAANVGAGIYVLNHRADGRWGGDAQPKLAPPTLSGTPVVGQFLQPLDGAMAGMAGGVNDFIDFRAALPVALDFFAAAGWALALLVPLLLTAAVVQAGKARRRTAEAAAWQDEVRNLRAELDAVKRHVGYRDIL